MIINWTWTFLFVRCIVVTLNTFTLITASFHQKPLTISSATAVVSSRIRFRFTNSILWSAWSDTFFSFSTASITLTVKLHQRNCAVPLFESIIWPSYTYFMALRVTIMGSWTVSRIVYQFWYTNTNDFVLSLRCTNLFITRLRPFKWNTYWAMIGIMNAKCTYSFLNKPITSLHVQSRGQLYFPVGSNLR